jgi:phage repressor protein C with HTH and peptisase S24 domain
MKPVKRKSGDEFHRESVEGVDAVLERMLIALGKPPGSYAQVFDVSENTIKTWKRRGAVSLKYLEGFARHHGVALDHLLGREVQNEPDKLKVREERVPYGDAEFVTVPRYDVRGSAGHGAVIHSEQIVDHLAFRGEWVRNALGVSQKDLALISVKGDSMEPTLSNEDLILIDMRKGHIEDNAIYVLQHNGDLLVKRIQRKLDGSLIVKSDNQRYDPEILGVEAAERLIVVGRVVWSGRRM